MQSPSITEGDYELERQSVGRDQPDRMPTELQGREGFYLDPALNPELARLIVDKSTEVIIRAQAMYPDVVGKELDLFEVIGTTKIRKRLTTRQIRREADRLLQH